MLCNSINHLVTPVITVDSNIDKSNKTVLIMKRRFTIVLTLLGLISGAGANAQCIDTIQHVDALSTGGATEYNWIGGAGYEFNGKKEIAFQRVMGLNGDVIGVTFDAQHVGASGSTDVYVTLYGTSAMSDKPTTPINVMADTVTIDNTYKTYVAIFDTPITVSSNMNGHFIAVSAIDCPATDSVKIFTSKDGEGEGNQWWDHTYWKWTSGTNGNEWVYGENRNLMIRPIVSFDITPSFATDVDFACLGNDIDFTQGAAHSYISNNLFNQDMTKTYQWDFGDGTPVDSVNQDPLHTFNAASNTASLTAYYNGWTNTCEETTNMTIYAGDPVADFNLPDNSSLTVDFTDASTSAGDWSWSFGDGNSDNVQNPNHTYAGNGSYDIKLVVDNGDGACADSVTKTMVFSVGMEENSLNGLVSVYPNPTNNELNFDLNVFNGKNVTIEVYNILGERLISESIQGGAIKSMSVSNLSNGKYLLKLQVGEEVATKVFVKQ